MIAVSLVAKTSIPFTSAFIPVAIYSTELIIPSAISALKTVLPILFFFMLPVVITVWMAKVVSKVRPSVFLKSK